MKKVFLLLAIMVMAICPQIMWAVSASAPTVGNGTSDNPYEISSAGNLLWFANQVNANNTGICGKLTADIDFTGVSTMIGTSDYMYAGTFDGCGYTITVKYSTSTAYTALFRYVNGATIKNLNTAGTISSTKRYDGGIISYSTGATTVSCCGSSVAMTCAAANGEECDGNHGGIVSFCAQAITMSTCSFTGKMLFSTSSGYYVNASGGLVGWAASGTTITNCAFMPSATVTLPTTSAATISRGNNVTIRNCYYTSSFGTVQGSQATSSMVTSGELCYKLNSGVTDGTQKWFQNIDSGETADTAPVPQKDYGGSSHSTVYDATDYCTTLSYTNICKAHTLSTVFDANGEKICSVCNNIIEYEEPDLDNGTYLLEKRGNFGWFANKVNSGQTSINAKLAADIDLTLNGQSTSYNETMIGTQDYNYCGTFDGNAHTITTAYTATKDYTAIFAYVSGATIRNLKTTGTISTGHKYAAGIVAYICNNTTITGCESSVAITSTFTTDSTGVHGGLVADNRGDLTLSNSIFDGKLLGEHATGCGGLVGLNQSTLTITGCLFKPSEVTFSSTDSYTMCVPYSPMYLPTVTNSAYFTALGTTQGTQVSSADASSGKLCYILTGGTIDGTQSWYQTIGTDDEPVLSSLSGETSHATVYGGTDACPYSSSTESYSNVTHTYGAVDADGNKACQNEGCEYSTYEPMTYDEATGYYLIANLRNFKEFSEKEITNKNINGKLTADIDLGSEQTQIGTASNPFSGTFDGNGHTITVAYTATADYTALFSYIKNATIKNLKVTGTISSGYLYTAGIVGYSDGTSHITLCECSVAITNTFTTTGKARNGGFVGYNKGTLTLTNCLFTGSLLGEYATYCGGMVGYSPSTSGSVTVTNSLFNPSALTVSETGSETMCVGSCYLDNSYYTQLLRERGGYEAYYPEDGWVCYYLNEKVSGGTAWYQTLGTDKTPVLDSSHGKIYYGDLACKPNSSSYSNKTHDFSNGTFGDDGTGSVKCANCSTTTSYQPATYDETEGAYILANKGNLVWFANQVNNGFTNINGKLTADVDLSGISTMIGTSEREYAGIFDGGGHTVTIAYTTTANYTALFRYVNGATIKNLKTAGTISTSKQFAAGLVAYSEGTTTLTGCGSSVAITSTVSGDGTHGGLVANNASTMNLTDCCFNGSLLGENTTNCGGLMGWTNTGATITNCLFIPSANTFSTSGASTMTRSYDSVTPDIINSYYASAFGTEQGTAVTSEQLSSGEACYNLNNGVMNGTQAWYQNISGTTDAAPLLDSSHSTVYGGGMACPKTLTYGNTAHALNNYDTDGFLVCETCEYVSDSPQAATLDGTTNSYLIANKGNMVWFANKVNAGETDINGTLTADIDLGSDQTMIGTSDNTYIGTFDGQHHNVKVNYETSEGYTALFRYVKDATIKNLVTSGSISTSAQFAAGIVAHSDGTTNMTCCGSSVAITSTVDGDGTHGGLVAHNASYLNLSISYFAGSMAGESTTNCGGLVGWSASGATITGCYYSPSSNTLSTSGASTMTRSYNYVTPTITNCYYSSTFGTAQGTAVTSSQMSSGEMCYKFNNGVTNGTQIWYQKLDEDNSPVLDPSHGTVYYGEEACPSTKTYSNAIHSFPSSGSGTLCCTGEGCTATLDAPTLDASTGYYLIASKGQLKWFMGRVNNGETTINGMLTADIDLGTDTMMIGNPMHPYAGTFSGADHTITVAYDVSNDGVALFQYVAGATITNLGVAGTITTSGKAAGGIICYSYGATLKNCASSVTINSTNLNCRAGGIVEEILPSSSACAEPVEVSTSSSFQNCLFDGSFTGTFTSTGSASCSGMAGYIYTNARQVSMEQCLCVLDNQSDALNSYTFAGGSNFNLTRCYYLTALNTPQGIQTTSDAMSTGQLCYKLNYIYYDGSQYWYQTIGTDTHPFPLSSHSIVYGGYDACPAGTSYSNMTHTGTKTGTDGYYQLTCTNTDCSNAHTCDIPTYSSDIAGYHIANKGNLMWFSHYVNEINDTINGTLESDIDLGTSSSDEGDEKGSFTPIGSNYLHPFVGTFDGQYHRIKNMAINSTESYGTGFFGNVTGTTTIENLVIDNTCTVSMNISLWSSTESGGIVGCVHGPSDIIIRNCGNEADVTNAKGAGGILGAADVAIKSNTNITLQNCYNTGTVTAQVMAGAMCAYTGQNFTFTNCWNSGPVVCEGYSNEFYNTNSGKDYVAIVNNCFNTRTSASTENHFEGTGVTKIDTLDILTGTLCRKLNQYDESLAIWAQNMDAETHPVIAATESGRSTGVTFTRTSDKAWTAICLPFDLTITDSDPYSIYDYSGRYDSSVYLSRKRGTLPAGTPAFVCMKESSKSDGNYVFSPTVGTISYSSISNPSELCDYTLTGAFTKTYCTSGYKLVDGVLKHVTLLDDNRYCDPFSAYLYGIVLLTTLPEQYALSTLPDTVCIANAIELSEFTTLVNNGIDYTNVPITLSDDITIITYLPFSPIGTSDYPFHGSFNGKGHRIKNLKVNNTTGYSGFFGYVGGLKRATTTTISNLIIDSSSSVKSTGTGVAGLVGCVKSTSGYDCAVSIESCGNEATITGTKNVAGLVGGVYDNDNTILNIISSYNTGTINGDSESATICGWANKDFKIEGCYNMGTISNGSSFYRASTDNYGTVNNCFDINGSYGSLIEKVTTTQIRNGYVCYELNGNDSIAFVQDLENDSYPLPVTCVESSKKMLGLHYTRSMTNQWGTLCLPFDITIDEDAPCDYYELEGVTDNTLSLKKVSSEVSCGYPVLVRMSAASKNAETGKYELSILQKDRSYSQSPNTDAPVNGLTLTGTYTQADITDKDGYIIANNSFWNIKDLAYKSDGTTHKTDDNGSNITVSCNLFRAYLAGTITSGAKQLTIGLSDDTTTAVEALNAVTSDTAAGAEPVEVYDFAGHRLFDLRKGVNIVKFPNGTTKKIIIK